jgi:large subunit ribosomal protein L6
MSRIGNNPIQIPGGVKVEINDLIVKVEGKGNSIEHKMPAGFRAEIDNNVLKIIRPSDNRQHRALHGTTRSLIQNIITGLTQGFEKKLVINGVGYKAQMKGATLVLDIGFSHSINFDSPEGITIETSAPTEILVKGIDKQKVGETAAEIRNFYPPEPYKGKGIRYENEYVRQKQGKTVA